MIRPLRDYIAVRPIPFTATASGLAVVTHEREHEGEIVAVGPGKRAKDGHIDPLVVQPGDRIKFADFVRFPTVRIGGEELLILQEADVAAVINSTVDGHGPEQLAFAITDPRRGRAAL